MMRLVPSAIAAVLALALAVPLSAQPGRQLRLTVDVRSGGAPVADATVAIQDFAKLTWDSGRVVFELEPGPHRVRVAKPPLGAAVVDLVLRRDTTVRVELVPARREPPRADDDHDDEEHAEELEAIIVTSTRTGQRIEDEPTRVEVLAREEIEEKMLMTPGDISMMLNETSGLRVQTTTPSLGGASVRVQGLRGRYTQILTDGLPLLGGQSGALGLLQVPPMDLGQVEVIKGAASALYGSSALGGVVNLVSRRPGEQAERELLVNGTTRGGADVVGFASGPLAGAWGYTLLASGHGQRKADVDDDAWTDIPGYLRAVVRPRLFWDDGAGRSVFLTAGATVEDREGGGFADPWTFDETLETRRGDVGAVARLLLGERRLVTVRASAMAQRHRHGFGEVTERDTHATGFAEAALSGSAGRHTWVVGAALQGERYRAADVPRHDYTHVTPSVFAQEEFEAAEWLTVSLAGRADRHSDYGTFLNPRLAVLLRPGPWTVRASAGTGWFAPTPFTEETEAVGLLRLLPLVDVEPERARTASLDVGRAFGALEVNATLFGSRVEDALQLGFGPGRRRPLLLQNAASPTRTWGTELLARWHAGPIHLTATHTYLRSTASEPESTGRREVPLTPRHAAGVVGMWEEEGKGRVGVEMYYTGRQALDDNPYRDRSRPYLLLGFLAERRFGPARLFVNFENLTDVRQTRYDPLVRAFQSEQGRWTTDVWAPLEGRVVNAGVRVEL